MCRLLGLLGGASGAPARWLVDAERSLLRQSNVAPDWAQSDGWGIAWARPGEPVRLDRGVGGAYQPGEEERFRSAAAAARGTLTIGHLRHASNPMNLPRSRLIGVENSQPFLLGATVFAHNGQIPLPRETRPRLGDLEPRVQGVNDSEVLFLLLAHHLARGAEPPEAYARTVADLESVWMERGSPGPEPFTGLNVLLARHPEELWAFCLWHGEHGSCFYDAARPYYQMAYRADAQELLVASEPFDAAPGWRDLRRGEYLHGRIAHGLVAVETGRVPIPSSPPRPSTPTSP